MLCNYCDDFPAEANGYCSEDCRWENAHLHLTIADQQDHAINGCDCLSSEESA